MDLHEYLRLLRRRWRLLAACVLVAGAAAFLATPATPSDEQVTYQATHTLLRDASAVAPHSAATVALFVRTGEVPARVAERVGFEGEPALLAASLTFTPDDVVGTLEITASGNSPEQAAERANIFAEETLAFLGEQASAGQHDLVLRVNERLTTLQAELDALDRELEAAEAAGEATGTLQAERDSKLRQYGVALDQQQQVLNQPPPSAGYVTLQPALPELASVEEGGFAAPTSLPARVLIATVLGAVLGLGALLLAERLDTRIHDVSAAAGAFALPVIAEVPRVAAGPAVLTAVDPASAVAESYRTLRSALLLSPTISLGPRGKPRTDEEPQVVLVTSPAPRDGKTTTVANLAAAMAETGRTVLVLSCDFRRPEIHTLLGCSIGPGLAELLTGDDQRTLRDLAVPTLVPGVWLAPSGAGLRNLGDVAAAGCRLVDEARTVADVVIIDTPPLLATNDASELLAACDAVVLVCRIGKTTVDSARRTRELLERLSAPVTGVVAIGVPAADTTYAGYFSSKMPAEERRLPATPLRRTIRSEELDDRIGPWRGSPSPSSHRERRSRFPWPEGDQPSAS
jgi:Mrp family chromosome partitioning ATPase/capsular polysaccharide biosynthesis protein